MQNKSQDREPSVNLIPEGAVSMPGRTEDSRVLGFIPKALQGALEREQSMLGDPQAAESPWVWPEKCQIYKRPSPLK
jgi:hypothetical protein